MHTYSVLFLCTGNSARSQLAEAIFRHLASDSFEVFSAGNHPESIDPRVYTVLLARGADSSGLYSKSLGEFSDVSFDCVISLCDKAKNECAAYPVSDALLHWDMADPTAEAGVEAFNLTADALEDRCRLFLKLNQPEMSRRVIVPSEFFKMLSDNTRLRILMLIEDEKELCVSDLAEAMQEIQPKISRHLAQMRAQKVLVTKRQGQQIFYRLNDELPLWAKQVLAVVRTGNPALINAEKIRLKALVSS